MTKKVASKEEERVNTRCLILKTLLGLGEASKQRLHEELKEKILARATLSKWVDELAEEDIVRIEVGPRGPVGTHNCGVTFKGLVYLFLECNLKGEELQKAFAKLLRSKKLRELSPFANMVEKFGIAQIIVQSLLELRPKVNLKYFDAEWFEQLLKEFFETFFLQSFLNMPKDEQVSVGKEADRLIMRAKAKDPRIKKDLLALCDFKIKNAQVVMKQKKWEIKLYRKFRVYARNL